MEKLSSPRLHLSFANFCNFIKTKLVSFKNLNTNEYLFRGSSRSRNQLDVEEGGKYDDEEGCR